MKPALRSAALLLALGMGVAGGACSRDVTAPTPIIESFGGTLNVGTVNVHSFRLTQPGVITIQVVRLNPPEPPIGMRVPGLFDNPSVHGDQELTVNGEATAYALTVFDPGTVTTPVDYSVIVTHF